MTRLPVVLLPGLDGTGDLFKHFAETAPPHVRPVVVSLPLYTSYQDLSSAIRNQLPATGPFVVLGESFSGPLAVAIAEEAAERVSHVILCNTFLSSPVTTLLRFVPWSTLFVCDHRARYSAICCSVTMHRTNS
jgi:pimeloyl-[acyl-carrier protein] methyl ester esterase